MFSWLHVLYSLFYMAGDGSSVIEHEMHGRKRKKGRKGGGEGKR